MQFLVSLLIVLGLSPSFGWKQRSKFHVGRALFLTQASCLELEDSSLFYSNDEDDKIKTGRSSRKKHYKYYLDNITFGREDNGAT
ncbi:hypothetical protein RRG08_041314 [Elysia crispata]|uniref:Uncharacterized protein n=1 Tax=Elysia crispata TaxID=231223 RepID=A0AAE1DM49_9GAST|nr:hypothetical protein RRG08_041314 [Elysia crispata]